MDERDRRAKLSAPLGLLIFLNVPIVYMSVRWWRTLHQIQSSPATLDPAMVTCLRLNAFAFLFLLILFIYHRFILSRREEAIEKKMVEDL